MTKYEQDLQRLKALDGKHPLLDKLATDTVVNRILLERTLKSLQEKSDPDPVDDADPVEDAQLLTMRRHLSNLYGDRAKLSNGFHDCETDAERRKVSERIQIVQGRIEMLRMQIRQYKSTGSLDESQDKYHVPEDPFKVRGLRDSIRASISRKKKEIMHLGREVLDNKPGAAERLQKCEVKLRDLTNHLQIVQKAIKDRNLQPE